MTIEVKSQRFPWATDDNYPAGGNPWNGQPTKVSPSQARIDMGFQPGTRAATSHVNYLLNKIGSEYDAAIDQLITRNFSVHPNLDTGFGEARGVIYAPANDAIFVIGDQGKVNVSKFSDGVLGNAGNDLSYDSDPYTDLTWIKNVKHDIAVRESDPLIMLAVNHDGVDFVGQKSGLGGTWSAHTTGLSGTFYWQTVAHGNDTWVIGGIGGNIAWDFGDPTIWTEISPPYSDNINICRSNKLGSPDHLFVAATNHGRFYYSEDGQTWAIYSTITDASVGGLCYNSLYNRWLAIDHEGYIYTSDNNSVSWEVSGSYLPDFDEFGGVTSYQAIATNDKNLVMVIASLSGHTKLWASHDCGDTFERIRYNDAAEYQNIAYAGGRFILLGDDTALVSMQE